MKNFVSSLMVAGALALIAVPASADIAINGLTVSQNKTNASVHFALSNTDKYVTQEDKMTITLLARRNTASDWKVVKVWQDQNMTLAGHDQTWDTNSAASPNLKSMLGSKSWEAKVVVNAPKNITVEKTFLYTDAAAQR